jgi:Xaa-Pro aminopeptidase
MPPLEYARRRAAALSALAKRAKAAAMLVTSPEDVSYLTGFSGEDSWLLLAPRRAVLLTDGRFAQQARTECPDVEVAVRTGPMAPALADAVRKLPRGGIVFQSEHVSVRTAELLTKALPRRRLDGQADLTTELRAIKSARELAAIRQAVRAAQRAFTAVLALGRGAWVGRTEREIAARLDYQMRLAGADGPSFPTIVAAGANAALPHYRPGNRAISANSTVLVDWGAQVEGYCSDLTRVVATGKIPPKFAQVYELVRRAQRAGIAAVRSGRSCRSVDAAAREVIKGGGMERLFVHGLGHGVGRQVHEAPAVASRSTARLKAGMVITVEPGVYMPGELGVRIEDDVLVTANGSKRLTSLPTNLEAMTLR